MSEKTKKIELQEYEKEKVIKQIRKNRKRVSQAVDTGKVHDVDSPAVHSDKSDSADINVFSGEYRSKYRNPFKRLYRIINEEELSENVSETVVRFFGIIFGIILLLMIFLLAGIYYFTYSSYSASYKRAVAAEETGNFDTAIAYYERALDKTENKDRQIAVLENLIRLSSDDESDFNLKTYLTKLAQIDSENTDPVERLQEMFISENDIDAIFSLAKELENNKNVEALYDIIQNQPQFNYKSGTYDESLQVSIFSETGERIYYTLDGSEASEAGILYTEPFLISEAGKHTIHAISINLDGVKSKDYSVTYNIISSDLASPVIYPKSGTYAEETGIVIEIPTGCTAYYTLDESEPDIHSDVYKPGMLIPYGNHVFTVKFIDQSGNESESVSRAYIYEPEYDVTLNEAIYTVKYALIDKGRLYESGDTVYNAMGAEAVFDCANIITLDNQLFYCIVMTDSYGGRGSYAVNVKNGSVFALNQNSSGSYYLSAVE